LKFQFSSFRRPLVQSANAHHPRPDRFAQRRCRWIESYPRDHPGVQINYQSIGSGGGIQQLKNGVVGFGACDMALDDDALKNMPAIVQIPESAEPGCITYNLPNAYPISGLTFLLLPKTATGRK
jgi:ABC-type phosphate transport system substrate-binding protein